ncbi:MAG: hypothetical protein A4E19_04445 [Nitrospira sp. SG-bin1]|nr:MAG: hypothetical protein A4E19_04445 [Nitrospira sp. SG-bin1]
MRDELVVDSDTQGEAGQPPIAETIFKKIDTAAVFVADVTFTAKRVDGRPTPNPNVLIEYGWALKSLGHSRVISVMNDAYGEPSAETLPFDLAHVRWPTCFTLQENASAEHKSAARRKLVASLKGAIRASLATISPPPAQPIPIFPKAVPKDGPARFRNANEELGYGDGHSHRSLKVYLRPGPAMWLRIMPFSPPGRKWTPRELKEVAIAGNTLNLLPLVESKGYSFLRAEDGWGAFDSSGQIDEQQKRREASSIVFAFDTGEIWTIDTEVLARNSDWIPFIQKYFNKRLSGYAQFIKALGVLPPYHWIAGITGVKGRKLVVPQMSGFVNIGGEAPVCVSDNIEVEGVYNDGQAPAEVLIPFYAALFEKCGIEHPSDLAK